MTAVVERVLFPIPEAMALLSLSRTVIYEQIRAGRLHTVTQGRRRYVTATAIKSYVHMLEQEAAERGSPA